VTTFGTPPEDPQSGATPEEQAPASSAPPGTLSPDGHWVWDGHQWQPAGTPVPVGPEATPGYLPPPAAGSPYGQPAPGGQYPPPAYGQYGGMATPTIAAGPAPGLAYAGFWVRFVAYLIDSVILGVAFVVLSIVTGGFTKTDPNTGLQTGNNAATGLIILVSLAYIVGFWGARSQTPGMMALNLRIVRADNGAPIDYAKAIIRYVGYIIASIPFGLGLIWAGFDARKQGWHDKIAGTFVVRQY
jgi:uncharacterized RDD family membrane protein YckC